ncbi:AcrR family transcriptional regulator [Chromobacterium vaccinii]|nr:AcrR family transcriptional regulator [Chromobacterium vaccinii]QND88239.1 AcrR family transcriptional regulator [Chromobacterium vaccinii]
MAGRPREFDRDQALEKAMRAFWARGYEGTSMANLVDALGIASARIYAAFGSKEALFREAVALYESGQGGFAERAMLQEKTVRAAIERMFVDAIETYTQTGQPQGCLVVSAAASGALESDPVIAWLASHRRQRTQSIIDLLAGALQRGELKPDTDVAALGDFYAVLLHGVSIQARDGVGAERLRAMLVPAMAVLDAALLPADDGQR